MTNWKRIFVALKKWLVRLFIWLARAELGILAIGIILAILVMIHILGPTENRVKCAGLLLQVLGLGVTLYGISSTKKLFNQPTLLQAGLNWVREFPLPRKGKIIHASALASASIVISGAHLTVLHIPPPDASLEDRIEAIEHNFKEYQASVDMRIQQHAETLRSLQQNQSEEQTARQGEHRSLSQKLERSSTDGLLLTFWSVIWVMAGLILSTFPTEIAIFLTGIP